MLEFLSKGKKSLLKLFSLLLIVTLVTNLININFEVGNYRLNRSIDELEEDKSILRAKYLSDTSLSRLDYKATALKMSEISRENCTKLSKSAEDAKFQTLKKNYLEFNKSIVSTNGNKEYLSGF